MSDKSKTIFDALTVARHVESQLPPMQEIDAELQAGAMGPTVTVPAIYLRIIIPAFEAEVLARERKEMEAAISKPRTAMSEEQITELCVFLASEAHARSHDPQEGAIALWKAAATIAVAHLPPSRALSALDGIHAITRADVAQAIGAGVTKQ